MRLFQLFIALGALCLIAGVSRATRVYDTIWSVSGNANNQFYDNTTYGGIVYPDPLTIVSNRSFRRQINANMICTGAQCHNGQYVCGRYGNTDCYHVEHIIDRNMKDNLPSGCEECIDAAGNKIMAWGRWNKALGGVARSKFAAALLEKVAVYGTIVLSAIDAIQACCNRRGIFNAVSPKLSMFETSTVVAAYPAPSNSTYNKDCDCDPSNPNCNTLDTCVCDSDSECGCDCDYDLEFAVAPAATSVDSGIAKATLVLLAGATCLIIMIAIAACILVRRIENTKSQPLAQQLDMIEI